MVEYNIHTSMFVIEERTRLVIFDGKASNARGGGRGHYRETKSVQELMAALRPGVGNRRSRVALQSISDGCPYSVWIGEPIRDRCHVES